MDADLEGQRDHWDRVFAANPDMLGTDPSQAVVAAAVDFRAEGVRAVLELGAGQGRDTEHLLAQGFEVTAIDYSAAALAQLGAGFAPSRRVRLIRHDVREPLPFADSTFDAVYAHMLFCMALTTTQLEALAAEVHRVLRRGGLLVYTARTRADAHFGSGRAVGDDMYEHGGFIVHFFGRDLVKRLADGYRLMDVSEFEEGSLPRRLMRVTQRAL